MPRKPAPDQTDEPVDQTLPDWPLPAEIIQAAAAGDAEALVPLLAQHNLGGRPQADLIVLAANCWRKYAPRSASLERLTDERNAARRHLEQLRRFQPDSVAACKELVETLKQVGDNEIHLTLAVGQAESAQAYLQFLGLMFTENRYSFYNARPAPEISSFFRGHNADPFTTDWRAIGKFTTPQPRPIIAAPARVNQGE